MYFVTLFFFSYNFLRYEGTVYNETYLSLLFGFLSCGIATLHLQLLNEVVMILYILNPMTLDRSQRAHSEIKNIILKMVFNISEPAGYSGQTGGKIRESKRLALMVRTVQQSSRLKSIGPTA